ncbi:hypothetical protein Patl1_33093 [Pistacia atlantica]|uniref:Uncharacterized protein n=1 Tax=Pistacia atlantica TaxID=434234 RepID=A0ACC1ALZ0_9ROSI|nr:hypothetical protein Patl1_33093 [Pistacia atlantica]
MWHKQHHLIILLLMLQGMKIRIWSLKKSRMMRMIRLKKIAEKKSVIFSLGIGRSHSQFSCI